MLTYALEHAKILKRQNKQNEIILSRVIEGQAQ